MKIVSIATAKRQAAAARNGINGAKGDAEVVEYRRLLRAHIKRLERRALKGDQEAVRGLGAMVLAMFVAEHNLRADMHSAIDRTLVA